MSKKDAAPTLGWVVVSHFNTFVVRVSLLVFVCVLVAGATIIARLDADCNDKPEWTFETFGYVTELKFEKPCTDLPSHT
jgi:hypothetical protein